MVIFKEFYPQVYLTEYQYVTDPNKDSSNQGTDERYMGTYGEEIDSYAVPLIRDMQYNLVNPQTLLTPYIPLRESMLGYLNEAWPWFMGLNPPAIRRNLLAIIQRMYDIRSTTPCYELMFAWAGLTATITENFVVGGFDSPYTFDDPVRTLDSACATCSTYDISLTGQAPNLTSLQYMAVETIINFNEPIDTKLGNLTYNGQPIQLVTVLVWVDGNGELNYDNSLDTTTTLLMVNGDLIINGPNASSYSLDANGDLIYTF